MNRGRDAALRRSESSAPTPNAIDLTHIRRFVSTALNERLGVAPHVAEVVLAHYPQGVAGTYNRGQYALEKGKALAKLADHLAALNSGETVRATVITRRTFSFSS